MSIFSTRYSFSLRWSLFFFLCLCPSWGQKENVISPACVISTTLWALALKRDHRFFSPLSSTFTNLAPSLPPFTRSFFSFPSFFLHPSCLPSLSLLFPFFVSFFCFSPFLFADGCCSRRYYRARRCRWQDSRNHRRQTLHAAMGDFYFSPPTALASFLLERNPPSFPPASSRLYLLTTFVFNRDLKFVLLLHPLIATRRNLKKYDEMSSTLDFAKNYSPDYMFPL